ncbi:hypothetical protein TWF718_010154 [Orbilia javanica]|uniref:Uncharacterized protein n=1 Tax=Orbilia javanica TaxID=47235 RepID=A0AAN8RDT9_9PEZI
MHLSSIAGVIGLLLLNLVSSETISVDPKGFATFVQKNEKEFKGFYKALKEGKDLVAWPGIPTKIFPLDLTWDDNPMTEALKAIYDNVANTKEQTEKMIAERPGQAEARNIRLDTPDILGDMLLWADGVTTREIKIPDGVWQGQDDGVIDMPVFAVVAGLFDELGQSYPNFRKNKDPLVLAKWLYASRPFDEPDSDGEVTPKDAVDDVTVDIDSPRLKLLVIADITTTLKDILFQGTQIAENIRSFEYPTPLTISKPRADFDFVQQYLGKWVAAFEDIRDALEKLYMLEIEP